MPATDQRFLDATLEEMMTDIWAHRFKDDPKLLEEIEDEDFDMDSVADQIGYGKPQQDPGDWEDVSISNGK
jgi:hypothetical protein